MENSFLVKTVQNYTNQLRFYTVSKLLHFDVFIPGKLQHKNVKKNDVKKTQAIMFR